MKAARNEIRRIKINKGGTDAFNKFIPLDSGRTTRSILAEISQSYEIWLLKPVVEYLETTESKVVIWMHDGFSMIKGRDYEKVKQACKQIVKRKADEKEIITELEWPEEGIE